MVTFVPRPFVLVGAIAASLFYEAAVCSPSHAADYYAFGNADADAVLELEVNGTWISLTTQGVQGWISNQQYGLGGSCSSCFNTNYLAGILGGAEYKDYFAFNLASLDLPSGATVDAATLVLGSGIISTNLPFELYGVTTPLSDIQNGSPNPGLFASLTSGPLYGEYVLSPESGNPSVDLSFALNAAALAGIEAALANGQTFVIAGADTPPLPPAPEPSTWVMMLVGFAGLGFVARRTRQRRAAA